jgi:hemerythrin-like domain-containing protein
VIGNLDTVNERLAAFGTMLVEIHDMLRRELADLRADVERHLDGRGSRPRELKAHCLAFCSALGRHHTGEDAGAFPLLARDFPELRPLVAKMAEDHQLVAGLLRRLDEVLSGIPDEPDAMATRRVLGELDGLTAILESHFGFEEREIVTALDSLPADHTAVELFGLDAPGED